MKKRPTSIAASASGKGKSESRKRRYIQLNPQAPFSEGVLVGNTLYLSGYIGVDQSGNHVPDDIETEARNVMNGIGSVLQKAGMEMDDLVYVQVFCPDVSLWQQFNQIYCSYFTHCTPVYKRHVKDHATRPLHA